ncbi:hypothetical protein QTP70_021393, partial [Hemibagrus guttatus]
GGNTSEYQTAVDNFDTWCELNHLGTTMLGKQRLGIVPLVLLALTITLILVFFPRASELPSPVKETQIVDTFFIGRYVLLAVASVIFLASLFLLLPFHLLEPVYAKPLRDH